MHRVRFPLTSCVKEHYNRKPFEACSYCAPCCAPRYQGTGGVHIFPKCAPSSLCPFAVYALEHFLQVCTCKRNMSYYADPLVALHSIDGTTDVMGHLYQNILLGLLRPCESVFDLVVGGREHRSRRDGG